VEELPLPLCAPNKKIIPYTYAKLLIMQSISSYGAGTTRVSPPLCNYRTRKPAGAIMKGKKNIIWRKYHALDKEVYRAESGHLVAYYFFAVVFLAKVNC